MDELDLLNRFRDEVPAQVDLRAEERRLAAAMLAPPRAAKKRVSRVRVGFALAAACAMSVTFVAVAKGRGPSDAPQVSLLERAALVAERTAATDIRPDQWYYQKESMHTGTFEFWFRMDGTKTAIKENGGELRTGPGEKGPTNPAKTQLEVDALPGDPDALLTHFRGLSKELYPLSICQPDCPADREQDVKAFGAIGWYLKYGPIVPPEKTAGMYRALAKIPGVTVTENDTDATGRKGVGVTLDLGQAGKGTYILDPADYHYMGVKSLVDGRTVGMTVLASGVVDKPGQLP
ncbi:CU044_5270 family protein [Nonomuraea sp. NPDC050556]|uniref:CU044_5270 family protein n=1 Tax=Nonomuraea sp. NPDC050556 TaxID=3364369 RepID=UPI0037B2BCB8